MECLIKIANCRLNIAKCYLMMQEVLVSVLPSERIRCFTQAVTGKKKAAGSCPR